MTSSYSDTAYISDRVEKEKKKGGKGGVLLYDHNQRRTHKEHCSQLSQVKIKYKCSLQIITGDTEQVSKMQHAKKKKGTSIIPLK